MFRTFAPSFFAVTDGGWSWVDAGRDSPMLPNGAKRFGDDSALALSERRWKVSSSDLPVGQDTVHGKETPPKIGRESGP